MRKLFFNSLFIFIILAGCSNDDAYNNALQKGLDHIASEEYQKAESAFELALDEKENDEKATALLEQIVFYQEALKAMEEGDFDIAKEKADNVINIKNGSSALIKYSERIVTSIKEVDTTLTDVSEEYEAALKQFEDKKYKEADKLVDTILKNELEQPIFKSIKDNVNKLQKDIESALVAEEKAEKEKTEQEKIAKEKAATEERPSKEDVELFPNQEGFYDGVRYSGEIGTAGPDEYHTVEQAREMGYEVIPITRHPTYGSPMIEGLDKPYPYDRWEKDYEGHEDGFTHIEGRLYELQGKHVEFVHTEIMEHKDEYRAVFLIGDDYVDFGF